jgi:hypothetical protein
MTMAQPASLLQQWILEWQRELLARAERRTLPGQQDALTRAAVYLEK